MTVYISLLRGINVGGQKKIRMEELRAMYEALGYAQVATYIQSGNVVFSSNGEVEGETIEGAIIKRFGLKVPVILCRLDELGKVLADNPFLNRTGIDDSKLHVAFLDSIPDAAAQSRLQQIKTGGDEFAMLGKQVYLYCPNGYGRSKYTNTHLEQKLLVKATTRNWRTANQLYQMACAMAGR